MSLFVIIMIPLETKIKKGRKKKIWVLLSKS